MRSIFSHAFRRLAREQSERRCLQEECYGRNHFKDDRGGIAYHMEMDLTGGASGIEAGVWDSEAVPAATRPCCEAGADYGRRFGRQTIKEVGNMWMLKFYRAYAKDRRPKRLLAYWGKKAAS